MNKLNKIEKPKCPNCLDETIVYNGIEDKFEKCDCNYYIQTKKCINYDIIEDIDIDIMDDILLDQEEDD